MSGLTGRLWQRARRPGVVDRTAIAERIAARHERLVTPLPLTELAGRSPGVSETRAGGDLPVAQARPAPVDRVLLTTPAQASGGMPVVQLKAMPAARVYGPLTGPPVVAAAGDAGHALSGDTRPAAGGPARITVVRAEPARPRPARPGPAGPEWAGPGQSEGAIGGGWPTAGAPAQFAVVRAEPARPGPAGPGGSQAVSDGRRPVAHPPDPLTVSGPRPDGSQHVSGDGQPAAGAPAQSAVSGLDPARPDASWAILPGRTRSGLLRAGRGPTATARGAGVVALVPTSLARPVPVSPTSWNAASPDPATVSLALPVRPPAEIADHRSRPAEQAAGAVRARTRVAPVAAGIPAVPQLAVPGPEAGASPTRALAPAGGSAPQAVAHPDPDAAATVTAGANTTASGPPRMPASTRVVPVASPARPAVRAMPVVTAAFPTAWVAGAGAAGSVFPALPAAWIASPARGAGVPDGWMRPSPPAVTGVNGHDKAPRIARVFDGLPLAGAPSVTSRRTGPDEPARSAAGPASRGPGPGLPVPARAGEHLGGEAGARAFVTNYRAQTSRSERADLDVLAGRVQRRVVRQLAIEAERRRFR